MVVFLLDQEDVLVERVGPDFFFMAETVDVLCEVGSTSR